MASTKFLSNLVIDGSGGTVLDVQGSVGQLFSVTDSLTGDLFAVSDISGIPILNVNSSGAVDIDGTLSLGDSNKIQLGASQDLQIFHNGNDSYIQDSGTGDLRIISSATKIYDADSSHFQATFTDGGSVDLYYGGNKKFETTSAGISVTGNGAFSGSVTATGTVQGSYVTANNTAGAGDGSAQEVARFVNTRSGATSSYMYIGAASGTDWRLGKNINGTSLNTNFGITKHSGTDIFLEIDGTGNTSILGSISASNFSGSSSGTNTGDQDLSGLISSITVGTGLDGTTSSGDATISLDLAELTNNTATFAPTQDHFVILDDGVQAKKLGSSIFGSAAYEASSAFAATSHNHSGVYVPEYEALQPTGSDREMNVWRKTHAVYSDDGGASTYFIIQTEVPQDNASMGGFTLVYQDDYSSSGEGGEIKIYGYWNAESNGGFTGFRYECSNPYHTPTIEVCRNSDSGNTAFFISGEGGSYTQLIAKDLWLGYAATSATSQWGNGWVISQASDKTGYTNFDTLNRNDFAAITTDGSTPYLNGGVDAAEVRTLIGAQVAGSYLTAHPSITEAADVNNSGGTVIQDLTFDDNGHVTATGSVNLDNIYTSTDGTENDYRFGLNLSNFSGTRWYKVATVNVGSGGLRIRGMMTNHVESFGSNMIDLAIQGREGNNNNEIEVTGHVHVLHQNAGIAIYSGEKPGSYTHWDVYVVATQYTQCQLDLTGMGGSFDTSKNYVTTEPTGTSELETYELAEGNYVIGDSAVKRIFDSGITLAGGLSYTPSTNTLTQTDNNTTYSAGTGLTLTNTTFSVTSGTYASASHNHNGVYLSTSGGEISKSTNTTGTGGTTFLTLTNDVGGDISQQQTFIDFKFTDTNANWTPQVRIGAQVGRDADASAISKEGAGAFVVYTGDGTDEVGGGSLTEALRVSYNGNATVAGSISADNLVDATTSASGFMSSTDKTKLDGVATGADVTPSWVPSTDPNYLTSETFGSSDVVLSLSGTDVTAGESITLAGGLSYSGTTLTSANDNTTYTAGAGLTLTDTTFSVTANTYATAAQGTKADNAAPKDYESIANLGSPDAISGTWVNAGTTDWGTPRIGSSTAKYTDGTGYIQFNIPDGMKTAYLSQLTWSSGGYFYIYGIQSDGGAVLLRVVNSKNSVENANEGNPNQHDGSTTVFAGTGLDNYSAIRIQNKSGRLHLTGLGFTSSAVQGSEGMGLVHPSQLSTALSYNSLINLPTLGTAAAAATTDFAAASHTHSAATTSAAGFMSTTDKTKLDGIETSADVTDTANVVAALTAGTNVQISDNGTISATDTDTVYTHPTTAGNKHIPTGGSAGQFLKYSSSGTAVWATPSYTTNTDTQLSDSYVRGLFTGGTNVSITAAGVISSTDTTYSTADFDAAGSADAVQSNLDTVAGNVAGISNQSNTDVDTGTETIAQVSTGTYTAAFFDFVIKNGTNVRAGTVYSCHDGTNVEFTETSTVDLGDTSDVSLAVDISGTNMRLRATTTSNNWSVKSLVRAI
jgi:hypothetical protein